MLSVLRISHFAIIDALEARFERGFNVVTGETGAGKSILIDALHLLLGGRAQADVVRTGFDECSVEGLFEVLQPAVLDARLQSIGLPACEEGQLVLRRTVHREGRSRAWVNGSPVTIGQLGLVARGLVDISGQHEHTSLMDPAGHLLLLDLYAGLGPKVAEYRELFDRLSEATRRLESLQLNDAERARRIDYIQFQLEEIENVDPQPGEDVTLREERVKLASAGKLRDATRDAEALLYSADGSASEQLSSAVEQIAKAAALDASLQPLTDALQNALAQVDDAARQLGRYSRGIDDDPARLDAVDERLEALKKLTRKHGGDLAAVLARRDQMRRELEELGSHEDMLAQAKAACDELQAKARRIATELTEARRQAATAFSEAVVERLGALEMKRTVFVTSVRPAGAEQDGALAGTDAASGRLTPRGQDVVEFLLSPNPGEEPRPLARIASGGELSRVMLAIKRVLAERDPVETYVFDEVDAGIGGTTGEVVGRMIREVGRERQVICITHLAQIAAYADTHFIVAKGVHDDGRTHSSLTQVDGGDGRQREVARMLSGHLTPASLAHADELILRGLAAGDVETPRRARAR